MKFVNRLSLCLRKKQSIFFIFLFYLLHLSCHALHAHIPNARKHRPKRHTAISKWISETPIVFSRVESKYLDENDLQRVAEGENKTYMWEKEKVAPFTELILSWNALRPTSGMFAFWINVKYGVNNWSGWQRMVEWGEHGQRSFLNKTNPYVHTKHVRVEMQHGTHGRGFKIKVVAHDQANPADLRALFVCQSNLKQFKLVRPQQPLPSTFIRGVPKQSQMVLDHPRFRDLCSPTSAGILVNYFATRIKGQTNHQILDDYICHFANKVHDGKLNIYGNWQLNVAQAFDALHGDVFFRVERLNSFYDLHAYLMKKIPVALSVHRLAGGALPYNRGHFMVVVGWSQAKQKVYCVDPAFKGSSKTLRAYKLWDFLQAWGRSVNLSYIAIPNERPFLT